MIILDHRSWRAVRSVALFAVAVALLAFLWWRNAGLLGSFYDYSIIANGSGCVKHGVDFFSDSTIPIPSLTFRLARLSELFFGDRFLAMALANGLIALVLFFSTVALTRRALGELAALLLAFAITVGGPLQHGIIWYNTVGAFFLVLSCLHAARIAGKDELHFSAIAVLLVLVFLAGWAKLNWGLAAWGVSSCLILGRAILLRSFRIKALIVILAGLLLVTLLPPIVESAISDASLGDVLRQLGCGIRARRSTLRLVFLGSTWIGQIQPWYTDNYLSGFYFLVLCMGVAGLWITCSENGASKDMARMGVSIGAYACQALFLIGSVVLSVSNRESHLVTSAPLLAMLAAFGVAFRGEMSSSGRTLFDMGLRVLLLFFVVPALVACVLHSRLLYGDPSLLDEVRSSGAAGRQAVKEVLYDAPYEHKETYAYLDGVRFTKSAGKRLREIASVLKEQGIDPASAAIYWTGGLEILNRCHNRPPPNGLPVWFDYDVSVAMSADEVNSLVAAFDRHAFEWVLLDRAQVFNLPDAFIEHLNRTYQRMEYGPLVVYRCSNAHGSPRSDPEDI